MKDKVSDSAFCMKRKDKKMGLIGAVLGDIAGSPFEFQNSVPWWQNDGEYDLFGHVGQSFTDDTVMSIACADTILSGSDDFAAFYRKWGAKYPDMDYGWLFRKWLENAEEGAYNSFGNGAAMRASCCGMLSYSLEEAKEKGRKSAECTHNHPEGIKGAEVLSAVVWMASNGHDKAEILDYAIQMYPKENYEFSPEKAVKEYSAYAKYDVTCQVCVPVAIRCFYDTKSFEECMYLINSMMIDTDTVGAIAGAICESFYKKCTNNDLALLRKFLPNDLYEVAELFLHKTKEKHME